MGVHAGKSWFAKVRARFVAWKRSTGLLGLCGTAVEGGVTLTDGSVFWWVERPSDPCRSQDL